MKSLLLIALTLVSVSSFATDAKVDHKKMAAEACKEKKGAEHKACVAEHMKAATTTTETAAAPTAPAEKHEMKK